jgi:hypothetical protein
VGQRQCVHPPNLGFSSAWTEVTTPSPVLALRDWSWTSLVDRGNLIEPDAGADRS